jgi:hypothetical protein
MGIAKWQGAVCGTGRENSRWKRKIHVWTRWDVSKRSRLLLHPSKEGIVILIDAAAAARV